MLILMSDFMYPDDFTRCLLVRFDVRVFISVSGLLSENARRFFSIKYNCAPVFKSKLFGPLRSAGTPIASLNCPAALSIQTKSVVGGMKLPLPPLLTPLDQISFTGACNKKRTYSDVNHIKDCQFFEPVRAN